MGPAASGTPAANICAVASCSAVVGPPRVPEGRNGSLFYWLYTVSLMQVPFLPISEGLEASGHLFASTPFSFVALRSFLPDGIATGKCDHFFSQPVSCDQDFITVKLHGWSNEDKLVSRTFQSVQQIKSCQVSGDETSGAFKTNSAFPSDCHFTRWRLGFGDIQDPFCLPQRLPLHKAIKNVGEKTRASYTMGLCG